MPWVITDTVMVSVDRFAVVPRFSISILAVMCMFCNAVCWKIAVGFSHCEKEQAQAPARLSS